MRAVAVVIVGVRVVVVEVVRAGERRARQVWRPLEAAEVLVGDAGVEDGDDDALALRCVPGVVGGDQAQVPLVDPERVVGDGGRIAVGNFFDGADDAAGGQRLTDLPALAIGHRRHRESLDEHRRLECSAVCSEDVIPAVRRDVVSELDGKLVGRDLRLRVRDVDAVLGFETRP